jgi:sulfur-oxidizing protein SoxY
MLSHSARVAGLLAAAGLLPGLALAQSGGWNKAAFDAKTMAEALKAMGAGAPAESKDVTITGPDIAENGAVVPIGASTAMFDLSDAVEANVSTRVKMGQSSNVYAVAVMGDGKVLYAHKEVKVTLGGCGG